MINVHISKSGKTLAVDWDSMPQATKDYIIQYGLRQKLNDAGASATVKELGADEAAAQAHALAENVLAALLRGEVTVRQAASSASLEERKYLSILKQMYKKLTGLKPGDESPDVLLAKLSGILGKDRAVVKAALEKKAAAEAEAAREIAAIQGRLPDIEL